jgi:exopolysaccharide biosynthesis polyprenyl glycosylphosphotransferase
MVSDTQRLRRVTLPLVLLCGDTLASLAGLSAAYWVRYVSPLGSIGLDVPDARYSRYLPLLLVGTAFLVATFAQLELYSERLLLRRLQAMSLVARGTIYWLAIFLSLSLVLKFDPPISRLFVVCAVPAVLAFMFAWRQAFHAWATRPARVNLLRQRLAVLGWGEEAAGLVADLASAGAAHPFHFCGVIPVPGDPEHSQPLLGESGDLRAALEKHRVDVLIAARTDLPRDDLKRAVEACEAAYVDWKIVPSSFQILVSGLRLQTVGRVPVLGVEDLAINRLFNRLLKRAVDVLGATVGLLLSAPLVAILAVRIRRESPGAPALFAQERIGAGHRRFRLYKLRSMSPTAEVTDHAQVSTPGKDPRLLRIGGWMRRWNLDELPQFWNVLKGDMALVGPRPERPFHVSRLSEHVPHYLPRHLVKPGMTGWAQVNGLRGGTAIERRVQHDIYYIENWSPWLDLQILVLTFFRWRNPAE